MITITISSDNRSEGKTVLGLVLERLLNKKSNYNVLGRIEEGADLKQSSIISSTKINQDYIDDLMLKDVVIVIKNPEATNPV